MNVDTISKAVTAAVRGVRAAGLNPASDEGQRHLNAVLGPVLSHVSAPPPSDQDPGGGDPLPDADNWDAA